MSDAASDAMQCCLARKAVDSDVWRSDVWRNAIISVFKRGRLRQCNVSHQSCEVAGIIWRCNAVCCPKLFQAFNSWISRVRVMHSNAFIAICFKFNKRRKLLRFELWFSGLSCEQTAKGVPLKKILGIHQKSFRFVLTTFIWNKLDKSFLAEINF